MRYERESERDRLTRLRHSAEGIRKALRLRALEDTQQARSCEFLPLLLLHRLGRNDAFLGRRGAQWLVVRKVEEALRLLAHKGAHVICTLGLPPRRVLNHAQAECRRSGRGRGAGAAAGAMHGDGRLRAPPCHAFRTVHSHGGR